MFWLFDRFSGIINVTLPSIDVKNPENQDHWAPLDERASSIKVMQEKKTVRSLMSKICFCFTLVVTCELKFQLMSHSIWAMEEIRDTGFLDERTHGKWLIPEVVDAEMHFLRNVMWMLSFVVDGRIFFSLHFIVLTESFWAGPINFIGLLINKTEIHLTNISI